MRAHTRTHTHTLKLADTHSLTHASTHHRLTQSGLFPPHTHTVMAAIKRCHEVVHLMGAPRISTSIRIGTRTDREQSMEDKVQSVEKKLSKP